MIELNAGGKIFTTARATLLGRGSPYFERLLEPDHDDAGCGGGSTHTVRGASRDGEGRIFVDRQHRLFEQILEYLRFGLDEDDTRQLSERDRRQLSHEAQFYQLNGLVEMLRGQLPSKAYDEWKLSDDDRLIRSQASELREALQRLGDRTALALANDILVDLFPRHVSGWDPPAPPVASLFGDPPTSPAATWYVMANVAFLWFFFFCFSMAVNVHSPSLDFPLLAASLTSTSRSLGIRTDEDRRKDWSRDCRKTPKNSTSDLSASGAHS